MHAQVVELVPGQAVINSRCEGVLVRIGPVKFVIKAPKDGRHGDVKLTVTVDGIGIDEVGLIIGKHEVTSPQVTVEEARSNFVVAVILPELLNHLLEVFFPPAVPATFPLGRRNLRKQALVNVKVFPAIIPGIVLHEDLRLVVINEAKLRIEVLVEVSNRPAQVGLTTGTFRKPVEDEVGVAINSPVIQGSGCVDNLAQGLEPVDFVFKVACGVVRLDLNEVTLATGFDSVSFINVTTADRL